MFPGLLEKDSSSEGGQVEKSERWVVIQLFFGYDASHVVSPLFPFPPTRYPDTMAMIRRDGGKTTSRRAAESPSHYGGYDPRLVTEWVRVQIPSKTESYLLREGSRSFACNGFPSRKKSSAPPLVICWDHHL
ncbi:hypothetical protein TNCV_3113951 [Trichonephila clavipes]|nr:hypothetical protein TNCV_3113951 [Trichonephila clavipes]